MAVTVRIPTTLRTLTGGTSSVEVAGTNVGEVLAALEEAHPGFRERIFGDDGELRRFVNVFVSDEDVRYLDGLSTPVPDGETVAIVPAVAKKKSDPAGTAAVAGLPPGQHRRRCKQVRRGAAGGVGAGACGRRLAAPAGQGAQEGALHAGLGLPGAIRPARRPAGLGPVLHRPAPGCSVAG